MTTKQEQTMCWSSSLKMGYMQDQSPWPVFRSKSWKVQETFLLHLLSREAAAVAHSKGPISECSSHDVFPAPCKGPFLTHLSLFAVGYSTCHWCHVMEEESFKSKEIGEIMNEHFVCIKVDREERPDVDKVYMTFVQVREAWAWRL